jgi:hypothetical protein
MTQYLTLTKENEDFKICFSWGDDAGVWIEHPTEKAKTIAHMIVHEVQDHTRHNRRKMSRYLNWESVIHKYEKMYGLDSKLSSEERCT